MSPYTRQKALIVWLLHGAVGVILLSSRGAGAAPAVGLGTWEGNVELRYELERQDTQIKGAPTSTFDSDRYRERFNIQNQGYFIYDPRLITGNLGLTLELLQEQNRFDRIRGSQNGQLKGYNFDVSLLPKKPYTVLAFANRSEDVLHRNFGTRSEIKNSDIGARFDLREGSILSSHGFPYFRSSLSLSRGHIRETTEGLGQTFRRNEDRDVVDYTAHKGFETADLDFNYKLEDVTDTARAQGAFKTRSADLVYSLDFGPTLNRRWDSRLGYLKRTGVSDTRFLTVNENLHIDHNKKLSTNYRYSLSRYETDNGTTLNQTGTLQLQHRLYKNLVTTVRSRGTTSDLPNGRRRSYLGGITLNYHRTLPGQGHVTAFTTGSYQVDDNDLDSSLVDIVDEAHAAPSVFGGGSSFTLNNPFVVISTIVVVDTRGGARLSTQAGIDYDVLQRGGVIEIIPIAGSLIIQPGDPLAISYTYEIAPSIRFSTRFWSLGGGVDYDGFTFFVTHEDSEETLLSGRDDRFLDDRRLDTAKLGLHGSWKQLQGRVNNLFQKLDSTRLQFTRWQFDQNLAYTGLLGMTLSATTAESFTRFDLPVARDRETYSARLALNGVVAGGWLLQTFASVRTLKDSDLDDETVREAGLSTRRQMGKLTIQSTGNWSDFERGLVETRDLRFEVRIARQF